MCDALDGRRHSEWTDLVEKATKLSMTRRTLAVLVVLVAALALRSGGPRTIGPYDEAYHWKRIVWVAGAPAGETAGLTHGLTALNFDADRGLAGAFCPWPPLYDLVMGTFARIVGLQSILWVPPVAFAAFAALMAFFWSSGADGHRELLSGVVAGLTIASAPYLIGISRFAAIDHHWVEPLLVIAILAAVLRRSAAGLAMAMVVALFVQTALIVGCGLAFLAIVMVQRDARAARAGAIAFAVSAAAIMIFRATRPLAYPSSAWFLGWTHAALLGAAAVACAVASARSRWLALACGAALVAPFSASLFSGARFFAGDPWLRSIIEFQPMFRESSRIGTDLANAGGGVVALILAMALERRAKEARTGEALRGAAMPVIALFSIVYLVLAISSRRFLVPGIALFAIAGAIAAASNRRHLAIAAVLLTLAPPLAYEVFALAHREPAARDPVLSLAAEVRTLPPGRVLAPWHAGHAIDVFGRHAVVIDNFGSMPDARTFAEANGALIETSPPRLAAWCHAHGIRYLALANPDLHLPAAAAASGLDSTLYASTPLASRTVWSRLWRGQPIPGFRRANAHVWEVAAPAGNETGPDNLRPVSAAESPTQSSELRCRARAEVPFVLSRRGRVRKIFLNHRDTGDTEISVTSVPPWSVS